MNDRPDQKRPRLALPARASDYEVGYGKPPVATRFQPGRSGNPKGRLKKTGKNRLPALNDERLKTIILEEAYRTISINDQNGQLDIPMAQAVVRSLAVNAAKGNQRAQRLFTQLLSAVERDNKRLHDEWFNTALDYKFEWERELERRDRMGITAPAPIPHPDDILIDMKSGSVRVNGPMTREDKANWDKLRKLKADIRNDIADLEKLQPAHLDEKQQIDEEIAHSRKLLAMISAVISD